MAIAEEDMTEAKELIASIYDLFNSPEEIKWVVESEEQRGVVRAASERRNGACFLTIRLRC